MARKEIVEAFDGVLEAQASLFIEIRAPRIKVRVEVHYAGENFVPGRNMWSKGTGASTLPVCNRDLYPDYGNGKGQPSNEQHSRSTLNIIVNISIVSRKETRSRKFSDR